MTIARTQMNKQLKNVPEGNKGLKKLDKDVRNKMGFMAKGGMAAKGMAKGGAVMAKGGSVKMAKGGAVMKAKGGSVKMAGGGMAKGYKAGGMKAKGGTKGGATGGRKTAVKKTTRKVAKKRDGIARKGKTRA